MRYLKKYYIFESLSDYRVSEDDFWFMSTYLLPDAFTDTEFNKIKEKALSIELDYAFWDMGVYLSDDKTHIEISWNSDIKEINIVEIMKYGDLYHVVSNESMMGGSRRYKFENLDDLLTHLGQMMD